MKYCLKDFGDFGQEAEENADNISCKPIAYRLQFATHWNSMHVVHCEEYIYLGQ
jgi:hypothetical protein